ncbi:MAG: RNA polymerase sigma-70 factor [Muribaculaceae bacterium]|nr:RNA polymerase sigma-70 factor [Muribaculaceae bacterium]
MILSIRDSRHSDELTFRRIYDELRPGLVRFADSYVRDSAAAEDIVAEAIIHYWEKRSQLDPDSNIPAYILTVVKHKCLNYLRHMAVREETAEQLKNYQEWELATRISTLESCDPKELFTSEIIDIVNDTLARMPERTRKVFLMQRDDNMSRAEIADVLGITPKGVDFHMKKALNMLRLSLKDYYILFIYILTNYDSGDKFF